MPPMQNLDCLSAAKENCPNMTTSANCGKCTVGEGALAAAVTTTRLTPLSWQQDTESPLPNYYRRSGSGHKTSPAESGFRPYVLSGAPGRAANTCYALGGGVRLLVELSGLGKRYPGAAAWSLRDVNVVIRPGEVYGLVGENGAGKTTLIRLLLGLIRPSAGRIVLKPGLKFGYVPDRPAVWTTFSVSEQLAALGRAAGLGSARLRTSVAKVLDFADLQSKARARVATLSRGMLQRLGIAAACLVEPELVVMDEPAAGLDPAGQRAVRELILAMRRRGTTVLLSSHYLVELERVCTRVGVLHQGQLVLDRELDALARQHRQHVELEIDPPPERLPEFTAALARLELDYSIEDGRLVCRNLDDGRYFGLTELLRASRARILSLTHPGLLEQVFLDVAGGRKQ